MPDDFWSGRRVLVTGATGFIGSWLTEEIKRKGALVSVFIKKGDPLGLGGIKDIIGKVKVFYGDVKDKNSILEAIRDQDIIFHLAAVTQVIYSIIYPAEAFEVNALGTSNILDAIRKTNNDMDLIYASTDKVYGEPKYLPIDEDHPLLTKSPYDASKLAADRLVFTYYETYRLRTTIARWSNTIGGRDPNKLRILPDFIINLINKKPPTIRGKGEHIRDYMYVTDAVSGIILLAEKINITKGEAFNFGTERPTTVTDLAKMIIKIMGLENKFQPVILGKSTRGEIDKQYLSAKKAREKLRWEPKVCLEEGIKLTVNWYLKNLDWQEIMQKVSKS